MAADGVGGLSDDEWGDFVGAGGNDALVQIPPVAPDDARVGVGVHEALHLPVQCAKEEELVPECAPLRGFDTLDDVQRYAVGALAVVLLNAHATDLNGAAFARSHAAGILIGLGLREGQQTALLALDPGHMARDAVVEQCVTLVGDKGARFGTVQAMLALALAGGVYDARSRAFLAAVAAAFRVEWRAVAAVELAVAIQVFNQAAEEGLVADEAAVDTDADGAEVAPEEPHVARKTAGQLLSERRKKKHKVMRAMKISGITLVGGLLFGVTGGLIAPALLSALAGVGVASAAGLAASGTAASGAVVGSLFGVAGLGLSSRKARKRTQSSVDEFDFERPDDPRVIAAKKRKADRAQRKAEALVAAKLAASTASLNTQLTIEDAPRLEATDGENQPSTEKELPRPTPKSSNEIVHGDEDDDDEEDVEATRKKTMKKLKVGARGLESAAAIPCLHLCICVPAWLTGRSFGSSLGQFEDALKAELPCSQHIALRWESRRLYEMGLAFAKFWASKATVTTVQQAYPHAVAAASSVAGAVAFAFAIPLTVLSCMDYIDNPWSVLVSRSNGAGEELADVLVERSYGQRPVTLFGYSIGARVIFKCLESLASRGALGIVDNVFLMGAAVTADPERWRRIRPVVAGRIVNGYGSLDWALAFFHRGCGHGVFVSGLRRVEAEGIENLNMAFLGMEGHRELKDSIPRAMRAMGVGTGYITMPPAPLVRRRGRSKSPATASCAASPNTETTSTSPTMSPDMSSGTALFPGDAGKPPLWHSATGLDDGSQSIAQHQQRHLAAMENDAFWDSADVEVEENFGIGVDPLFREQAETLSQDSVSPASSISPLAVPETSVAIPTIALASSGASGSGASTKKKKGLGKSWLSWGAWSGHLSTSGKKNKGGEGIDGLDKDNHASPDGAESVAVNGLRVQQASDAARENDVSSNGSADNWVPVPRIDTDDIMEVGSVEGSARDGLPENGLMLQDDADAADPYGGVDETVSDFDWERQRRIWEEQERQIQERGFADNDVDIEMGNKVVLGISVEVAGRRLSRFVEQDSEIPVAPTTQVFTNCMDDQRGLVVRLYEHEKRTKSVPMNVVRQEGKYPKLLDEVELRWQSEARKGSLRFAVSVGVNEEGDVVARVEHRSRNGTVADSAEIHVHRTKLCTMRERVEMETAERIRLQRQAELDRMEKALKSNVLALPAPPPASPVLVLPEPEGNNFAEAAAHHEEMNVANANKSVGDVERVESMVTSPVTSR